jgi:hypothetical protein
MLTTIEAEIDVNGTVTLLEPLKINKKSRAIITLLNETEAEQPLPENGNEDSAAAIEAETDLRRRRMEWLKANREKYGGQYVVLDGTRFLGVAKNYTEGAAIAKKEGVTNAFINYLSKPDEMGFVGGWD